MSQWHGWFINYTCGPQNNFSCVFGLSPCETAPANFSTNIEKQKSTFSSVILLRIRIRDWLSTATPNASSILNQNCCAAGLKEIAIEIRHLHWLSVLIKHLCYLEILFFVVETIKLNLQLFPTLVIYCDNSANYSCVSFLLLLLIIVRGNYGNIFYFILGDKLM